MTAKTPIQRQTRATDKERLAAATKAEMAENMARLLHELEVHRVELEMQNETLRQSQIALEESRDSYLDLYELAPIGYLALDDQGRIEKINLAGATLLGVNRSQVISQRFVQFVADQDGKRWNELLLGTLRYGEKSNGELRLRRKNDNALHIQIDCRKVVTGVFLTLIDISEQKRIEAQLVSSRKRYLALFLDATDAIAVADSEGNLEEVNDRFAALLGYPSEELRGISIERIHPVEELPLIRKHFAGIFGTGSSDSLETVVLCKNGRRVEVEIRPTLIELGNRCVAQGVFIDLTERRCQEQQRIEQERLQRNALVREVHHRIKNNLQSVSGLLQRELGKFTELNPRLQTAIGQVNAIAVVHGLQCDDRSETVRLCDSIRNICKSVAELSLRPVNFTIENEQSTFRPSQIASDEAVSVALVLNELILDAVKHSPPEGFAPTVSLTANGNSADIVIRNAVGNGGAPGIDIDAGRGLGTGLRLVRSLLPETGARVTYEADQDKVMLTRLTLTAPVIAAWNHQQQGTGCD